MTVTIIVPVYGVEKYIRECAVSLFSQTYDKIEYVFCDDCTPDRSIEILHEVMAEYHRLDEEDKKLYYRTWIADFILWRGDGDFDGGNRDAL